MHVLLFVAIDLLLRAVLGVFPGTTAIMSLFGNARPWDAFSPQVKASTMTDIDRLIDELVRRLRGRPVLEIVTAARQIENRVRDLYLQKALRKYAADRREDPSPKVVAALRRLLGTTR